MRVGPYPLQSLHDSLFKVFLNTKEGASLGDGG